jgi:hypothetical protein
MSSYDTTVSWEVPYSDVSLSKMIDGIVGCLIGLTFQKESIIEVFKEYVEENA